MTNARSPTACGYLGVRSGDGMTMDLFNEIAHRFGHVKSVSPGLFANGQAVLRVQFSYVDDYRDFVKVSEIKILLSPFPPSNRWTSKYANKHSRKCLTTPSTSVWQKTIGKSGVDLSGLMATTGILLRPMDTLIHMEDILIHTEDILIHTEDILIHMGDTLIHMGDILIHMDTNTTK